MAQERLIGSLLSEDRYRLLVLGGIPTEILETLTHEELSEMMADQPATAQGAPYSSASLVGKIVSSYVASPLNNPPIVPASEAAHLDDDDWVVGVLVNGLARAYPWWALRAHHTVVDFIGGRRVFITFCEACSAASAFYPLARDCVLDFVTNGDRYGTFELRDIQTGSSWRPLAGFAHSGPLRGTRLKRLPTYHSTWAAWKKAWPRGTAILSGAEVRARPHGGAAYFGSKGSSPWFESTMRTFDKRLPADELVYAFVPMDGAQSIAIPLRRLKEAVLSEETFEGRRVSLISDGANRVSAYFLDQRKPEIDLRLLAVNPIRLRDQNGTTWDEWGRGIAGPEKGHSLRFAGGYVSKWLVHVNAFPETSVVDKPTAKQLGAKSAHSTNAFASVSWCRRPKICGRVTIGNKQYQLDESSVIELGFSPLRLLVVRRDGEIEVGLVLRSGFNASVRNTFKLPVEDSGEAPILYVSRKGEPEAAFSSDDNGASGNLTIDGSSADGAVLWMSIHSEVILPNRRGRDPALVSMTIYDCGIRFGP